MKAYASFLLPPALGMASELPPFSEVTLPPASHCGIGATRHLPLAALTPDSRLAGIQAPMTSVAMVPSPRPLYQPSLQPLIGESSLPSMSFCHMVVNFFVPASVKSTVTLVPSTLYGRP